MHSINRSRSVVVFLVAVFFLAPTRTPAQDMVVGVNVVNPMRASVADQNALFAQLKAAHVSVIRCGISNDEKGIDFAKRARAEGIRLQLIVGAQYSPDAPSRGYQPDAFPAMWGGHPLSSADPVLSKSDFQRLFDSLDANGIELAGVELGNEINWAAFNPEFPLPGEGKILSLQDLGNDPEGKQVAKGFLQYIKVLAALKDVRDHSRLNRNTLVISAGLVSAKDGDKLYNNKKEDMVSLAATIEFLRAHGLDSLVVAYGIHSYPSTGQPGNPTAVARRAARLNGVDLAECRATETAGGKPCWITEWGFPNADLSCPAKEAGRTLLIEEMRSDFAAAAAEHRLTGIDYYSWDSDPWAKQTDPDSVYRCGALTESGRQAVALEGNETSPELGASIRIRVGVPLVARGPAPNIADSSFTEIGIPNGLFRGFTAAGTTFAIDGKHPYDMGGQAATVLKPGPAGSPSSCGQWITHVELEGKTLFGWVHNETACDYAKYGQTHAMMTIASSGDYGLTWNILGPIIRGTDAPTANKETGDSCMTAVRGQDGYDYAYCLHNGGHSWHGGYTFIARAPASDPSPGKWKKYFNGSWNEPGVDGKSSPIDGGGVAYLDHHRRDRRFEMGQRRLGPCHVLGPAAFYGRVAAASLTGRAGRLGAQERARTGVVCRLDRCPHRTQPTQRPLAAGVYVSEPRRDFRQTLSHFSSRRYLLVARVRRTTGRRDVDPLVQRRPARSLGHHSARAGQLCRVQIGSSARIHDDGARLQGTFHRTGRVRQPMARPPGPHPHSKGRLRNTRLPASTQRWIHFLGRPT
jgi:hypothetical protein